MVSNRYQSPVLSFIYSVISTDKPIQSSLPFRLIYSISYFYNIVNIVKPMFLICLNLYFFCLLHLLVSKMVSTVSEDNHMFIITEENHIKSILSF